MARSTETAEERLARLVGVARGVIAEEGVAACTFRRLARAAGCSTRPFTHAFGTREALLRAVALSTWEGSAIDVTAASGEVDRPADWQCLDELEQLGAYWLPSTEEQRIAERIYFEIVFFSLNDPALHDELLEFSYAANAYVSRLIAEGQRRGQVRTDEPADELAMVFIAYQAGIAFTALHEPAALPIPAMAGIWRAGLERMLRP